MGSPRRNNKMAPYFVQVREFERKLLIGAIASAGGSLDDAARILGVTRHYAWARAKWLGGVLPNDPKHEPPGLAADAWAVTQTRARVRRGQVAGEPNVENEDLEDLEA
jgi:Bacterial regulatory protein, Fis family